MRKTVRSSVLHRGSRSAAHASLAILLCFLFTACVGWGNFKAPAYVIDGAVGGAGAIMVLSATTQEPGDNGGAVGAVVTLGIVLIAAATLGTLITLTLPGPKKVPGTAQAWPE